MFNKIKPENLPTYIRKIESLFPEFTAENNVNSNDIRKYYRQSFWGYALFHSWAGAIHMAMSPNGRFSKNDYFRQAEEIEGHLSILEHTLDSTVVEIGCGRAFNIRYLAKKFSDLKFRGLDLSERNLRAARKQTSHITNMSVAKDDFHSLSTLDDDSADLIFAVETLCHATDLDRAMEAISRVLKKGGELIVYDGFRGDCKDISQDLKKAMQYTEKAMAVPFFRDTNAFIASAEKAGLRCYQQEDRSDEIMPNLIRLSDLAKAYFKIGPLSRLILAVVPRGLVANAIAGLLMAVTVQCGAHRYVRLHFKLEN